MPLIGQTINVFIPRIPPTPYWQTRDGKTVRLWQGDAAEVLSTFPSGSVHCVVTSPPYWGLRNYGNDKPTELGSERYSDCQTFGRRQCNVCYVCRMVSVFKEVYRILRDDGVCWLNLGDTYAGGSNRNGLDTHYGFDPVPNTGRQGNIYHDGIVETGIEDGNLIGIPWRVALALQANNWILRGNVIWAKRNPMPDSADSRCTKSHEHIFQLTKTRDYFFDMEAIKERNEDGSTKSMKRDVWHLPNKGYKGAHYATFPPDLIRPCILSSTGAYGTCAKCGVCWRRVIDRDHRGATTSRNGSGDANMSCSQGKAGGSNTRGMPMNDVRTIGWEPSCECFGRQVKYRMKVMVGGAAKQDELDDQRDRSIKSNRQGSTGALDETEKTRETWVTKYRYEPREQPSGGVLPLDKHPKGACIVLDPFMGSGTTAQVCIETGLANEENGPIHCWGIELKQEYLDINCIPRIEGVLWQRPITQSLIPKR